MSKYWFRVYPWPGKTRYDGIRATFVPSEDELLYSGETQSEIRHILRGMEARGLKFDAQGTPSVPEHIYSGEVVLRASKIISPAVFIFLGVWLQAKVGRKIRIKFRSVTIEASTVQEAKNLLKSSVTIAGD